MATEAQTKANCENAQASTGPQTREGKLNSSRNSLKFGLFSTKNCVFPDETEEYSDLCRGLWESLNPVGSLEEMFATEIIRNAWRLRRCAATEASLVDQPSEAGARQAAVDRARTQATGGLQRNMAELRRLQTERWTRRETLPASFDVSSLGLAASKRVIETLSIDATRKNAEGRIAANASIAAAMRLPRRTSVPETSSAERTQPSPRNAPCPCGSDLKYKRCCGKTAPAVLHAAA